MTNLHPSRLAPEGEPAFWRELADIPGQILLTHLEISPNSSPDADPCAIKGKFVDVMLKATPGRTWTTCKVLRSARVYGVTCLFLEMTDGTRWWQELDGIRLLKLNPTEIAKFNGTRN